MMTDKNTKYCHGCQAQLELSERRCPYCHCRQQRPVEVRFERLMHVLFPSKRPATSLLFGAIIIYFIIIAIDIMMSPDYGIKEALLAPPSQLVYRWGAHVRGQSVWWRLITANFVHFGILHLVFNCSALRYVAPYVERTFGSALTLASFIVLGTGSMLCSNLWGGEGIVAGASGGLMAFIGMAAVSAHRENTQLSLQVRNSMLKWAAFTFIFGLTISFTHVGGIDNIAHISGFIAGCIGGYILPRQATTGFSHLWQIRASRILAFVTILATVAAFASMGTASMSTKHQRQCINHLKLQLYDKAEIECRAAYENDKTQVISYHNYILVEIIRGERATAEKLCLEGRRRFKSEKELSFDELCRSIGK